MGRHSREEPCPGLREWLRAVFWSHVRFPDHRAPSRIRRWWDREAGPGPVMSKHERTIVPQGSGLYLFGPIPGPGFGNPYTG